MAIDPETRDVVHNIYLPGVEKVNGELWNVELATVENVKDPVKAARKLPSATPSQIPSLEPSP
jgi:branched-chain amino acid transport system substrate-binding protein